MINDVQQFFYPLIDIANCVPFLAFYNDIPAATLLVFCGKNEVGIYACQTMDQFRRKGVGSAILTTSLIYAKDKGMRNAVLYSSIIGQHLYNSLGFTVRQKLYEYSFNN